MEKEVVRTQNAPGALGPYSQAIVYGDMVFCSGQIGIDPETKEMAEGIQAQTHRAMKNLQAVLEAAGSSFDKVVRSTIFVANMNDFKAVNEVYAAYFDDKPPARATVEASALPLGALVEIDMIAVK